MKRAMLTTVDNPHSPFDDFRAWYAFDERMGYHSTALLGRIAIVSNDLSEADYNLAVEQAIDEIVFMNVNGKFLKVTKEFPNEP